MATKKTDEVTGVNVEEKNVEVSVKDIDVSCSTEIKTSNKNKFFKISHEQFLKDNMQAYCRYEDIEVPKRATKGSAGYDFYAPFDFTITPGHSLKIPTGIKVRLNDLTMLAIVPRSSLGFKYKLKLDNTVAIIDSDYFYSDNEGHIWISMTNMSSDRVLNVKKGERFCQGIILPYALTEDDNVTTVRNGGMGSTNS